MLVTLLYKMLEQPFNPAYYSQLVVVTAGQLIGDCFIRVYRLLCYIKEYHAGYFPLCCYYD